MASGKEINNHIKQWLASEGIKSNPQFSPKKKFPDCKDNVSYEKYDNNYKLIKVSCEAKNSWTIYVKTNANSKKQKENKVSALNQILVLKKSIEIFRRDTLEKQFIKIEESLDFVSKLLDEIQKNLFDKAKKFRDNNITEVDNFEDFKKTLENKGGFISAHWDGTDETENKIKDLTKATIRCIPEENNIPGKCVFSGNPSSQKVLFAKAY